MKKALFAVAAVALLAGSVHAGEYKTPLMAVQL